MSRTKFLFVLKVVFVLFTTTFGQTVQPEVVDFRTPGYFPLVSETKTTSVFIDSSDYQVVQIAARHFAEDVERVTGKKPSINDSSDPLSDYMVIAGTLGKNRLINKLIENQQIDVHNIRNKWESFIICTIENPFPGVKKALVIAGSDRRGTAYGVFTVSEAIGVSPWYWWANIIPQKKKEIYIQGGTLIQNSPSIKYRGIFINDEGFGGLNIWARKTFDPELGDIGPKTYAKVFELMLRLKANYLWPAMHACTRPFYSYPDNKKLADVYAIVVGTSHCEQMLCNTMTEWSVEKQGPWNYFINRDSIISFWNKRIQLASAYENIYTLGLRGTEDIEMEGAKSVKDMVGITQKAIEDQRDILANNFEKSIDSIPQVLCTYKEVLVTYQNGLEVPEDVTLLWADDNHGYVRQLCTPEEQKRRGGSGVYYHLSLLGTPKGFLWLSTISPELAAYELHKAYDYGADRIWMINIGDIKPHEKELTFIMQMAWDINRWTPHNANEFIREWSAQTFGNQNADAISEIMNVYYRLAATGKPEHVHRIDYRLEEIDTRIKDYNEIALKVSNVKKNIPESRKSAFYELIEYPVMGCKYKNERELLAKRSLYKLASNDKSALHDADQAKRANALLDTITNYYNVVNANGKWNHMMNWHPFSSGRMPGHATIENLEERKNYTPGKFLSVDHFKLKKPLVIKDGKLKSNPQKTDKKKADYFATTTWNSESSGKTALWINASIPTTIYPILKVEINDSSISKELHPIDNVWHTVATAPKWYKLGEFQIKKGRNSLKLGLLDSLLQINKVFLGYYPPPQKENYHQIAADQFNLKGEGFKTKPKIISGPGSYNVVTLFPNTAPPEREKNLEQASWIEYQVPVKKGETTIEIRTLPTQQMHAKQGVIFAASLNMDPPVIFNIQANEFTPEWQENVIRGYTINRMKYHAKEPEIIRLRVYFTHPGVVLREIIIKEK